MSIVTILRDWGNQPDILCDVCGGEIRYPDHPGYVVWRSRQGAHVGDVEEYLIVHQGRCDPGKPHLRHLSGHDYDMSQALDEFIACVLHNTGLDSERIHKAKSHAEWLKRVFE
jgi:hypothetical protein